MDGYSVSGLPLHVLLAHAIVIVVPVAAVVVLVAAVWPRARRRLGLATPLLAVVAAALVPVVTQAGAWLLDRVPDAPLIQEHAGLGDTLWPWTVALAALSIAVYSWGRYADAHVGAEKPSRTVRRLVSSVLVVAAVVVVPLGITTTVVIGESGSRAVWEGSFSDTPSEK